MKRVLLCLATVAVLAPLSAKAAGAGDACGILAGGEACEKGMSCTVVGFCKRDAGGKKGEGCSAGFECEKGLTCEAGRQKCVGPGKEGDGCHATHPCGKGLSCQAGTQTCVAPGEAGDPCHATRPCGKHLSCEAGSQTCVGPGGVGDPCHATRPCGKGLTCAPGSQRCYHAAREEGEPCSLGFDCAKGLECEPNRQICSAPGKACSGCLLRACDKEYTCDVGLCRGGEFEIDVIWADTPKGVKEPSASIKDAMKNAVKRWDRVFRGHLPKGKVTVPAGGLTVGDDDRWVLAHAKPGASWHDVRIVARIAGSKQSKSFTKGSKVLAHATALWLDGDGMPRLGLIEINEDEMESPMLKYVEETLMHEMGHVLGFDDAHFDRKNLLSPDRRWFVGPSAIAAYKEAGGKGSIQLEWVPKEGETPGSHWSEESLDKEMMTPNHDGWITSDSPLSKISIAALADMGYEVNTCEAQNYGLPASPKSGPEYRAPPEPKNSYPGVSQRFDKARESAVEVASGPWGTLRSWAYCPDNSFANGFMIRVEAKAGKEGDDTALNAVRLLCANRVTYQQVAQVQSHPGYWGDWGKPVTCPQGAFLSEAMMRIEDRQGGKKDDTAANDVRFKCSDGTVLQAKEGLSWGDWPATYTSCAPASFVCGVQAKVEGKRGSDEDDTAMNGMTLDCCGL